MYKLLIFLLVVTLKSYSQTHEIRTLFDKDSVYSVTNYINKFDIIDSLVVILDKKNCYPRKGHKTVYCINRELVEE